MLNRRAAIAVVGIVTAVSVTACGVVSFTKTDSTGTCHEYSLNARSDGDDGIVYNGIHKAPCKDQPNPTTSVRPPAP